MVTRREFLRYSAALGAGLLLPNGIFVRGVGPAAVAARGAGTRAALAAIPGGTLDPAAIEKFVTPLVVPPAMPRTARQTMPGGKQLVDYYEIALRQFRQQILPPGQPPTTVWSYGSASHPGTFHYPAFTIEAKYRQAVRVKWINQLVDADGNCLPHLLPVDPTLHWANPPGGVAGRDMEPAFAETPGPYRGPVPMVTHVHGAHTHEESDGYAEAWYLPAASGIPAGYATVGSAYEEFKAAFAAKWGLTWEPGTATFQYPNDQRATTLWYHDHALGMTRLNVYAGPAGFYVLRGGPGDAVTGTLPGPAPALGDPPGTKYYEIPLAIQDRSFNADGALFYPDSRAFFDEFAGPYVPESDIAPIFNPEFFGNTMVVNGRTWPYLEVEQRRYRFRLLNGCNARFLILKLSDGSPFWQIGAEGGFLPAPVQLGQLLLAPAERADVIVDFGAVPVGTAITLLNLGPDEPFGGGVPDEDFDAADPATTGQVLQFRVVRRSGADRSTPPGKLALPAPPAFPPTDFTRQLSLNEVGSAVLAGVGPRAAFLGILNPDGSGHPLHWDLHTDPITENPAVGATEVWELYNFTADAHPIHIHQVQFRVLDRQPLATDDEGEVAIPVALAGTPVGPEAWEAGDKDTVVAYPGQVTRVKATFDLAGLYVWHCHIVEHEDHEMMRPFRVGP